MRERPLTIPEIALIGGTRVALGAGLALLLADRLNVEQRRAVGWTLFLVGAVTTIPLKPTANRYRGMNLVSKSP